MRSRHLRRCRLRLVIAAGRNILLPLAIVAMLNGAAFAQGVAGVGLITAIEGDVILVRNGQTLKVAPSMALQANDKVTTGIGSRVTIRFGDNSTLGLEESATIIINEGVVGAPASGIRSVGLLGGHLHTIFNAGLRGVGAANFDVRTPNAIAGVRGTEFDTAYISGTPCPGFPNCLRYTDVAVLKGRVEVRNPLNPKAAPVIATGGYETTVPCEEPPATPSPLGLDKMLSPSYR